VIRNNLICTKYVRIYILTIIHIHKTHLKLHLKFQCDSTGQWYFRTSSLFTLTKVYVKYENDVWLIQKSPISVRQTNAVNISRYRKRFAWRSATVEERGAEGSSEMQDTVKLPAESPIPRGVGGRRNGLCPLRALGTTVQAGICLVSLFMRSNIVIWHRTGEFSVPCGR